jgi:hypothetical protein
MAENKEKEEKEEQEKVPYEPPRLFDLGGSTAYAAAPCNPGGSPAGGQCRNGSTATTSKCQEGSAAGGACQSGSAATGGKCQSGSVAAGKCQTGSTQ